MKWISWNHQPELWRHVLPTISFEKLCNSSGKLWGDIIQKVCMSEMGFQPKGHDPKLDLTFCGPKNGAILVVLLMVQKSGIHQLRLVAFPIIYRVLYIQPVVAWDFWTINSIIQLGGLEKNYRNIFPQRQFFSSLEWAGKIGSNRSDFI